MRNLKTVYLFELGSLLKKKAYIVTTVIICALILVVTTLPTIQSFMGGAETGEEGTFQEGTFGIYNESDEITLTHLGEKLPGVTLLPYDSEEALKEAVLEEEVSSGYILKSSTAYVSVLNNVAMYSGGDYLMDSALRLLNEDLALQEGGHDVEAIRSIMSGITITQEEPIVLGKDVQNNYWVVYILIMLTFMMIMFYGNNVATYVAREKSDRTMEILITSSDSNSLIIGKVLASGTAGIIQALFMGVTLFIGYRLNYRNYDEEILDFLNMNVDPKLLLVYFIFAFTGYFLFLFVYASIGALMTKVEDVPSATTLVTMFVMAAYFIAMFSLGLSNESIILKIASYFPFTSFMVMFVRYAITSVSLLTVAISYGILILTAVFTAFASVKIYRFGTLNYGNTGSVVKLIKTALKDDNGR